MLSNELPKIIYPHKLCRKSPVDGTHLTGEIPLRQLRNLTPELKVQGASIVKLDLLFSVDDNGYDCIQGNLDVDLVLTCQRCLEPMKQTLNAPILVSPVESDAQAKQLPTEYEPLLMIEGQVDLADWIAEELHLALPLVPCHNANCVGLPNNLINE